MSRHRDFKNMNYEDEYDDDDDYYEEAGSYGTPQGPVAYSPSAQQYLYNRNNQKPLANLDLGPAAAHYGAQHSNKAQQHLDPQQDPFFKKKPDKAKKNKQTNAQANQNAAGAGAGATTTSRSLSSQTNSISSSHATTTSSILTNNHSRPPPGFAPLQTTTLASSASSSIFGDLELDEEAKASSSSLPSSTPTTAKQKSKTVRSAEEEAATLAAIEELRLAKQNNNASSSSSSSSSLSSSSSSSSSTRSTNLLSPTKPAGISIVSPSSSPQASIPNTPSTPMSRLPLTKQNSTGGLTSSVSADALSGPSSSPTPADEANVSENGGSGIVQISQKRQKEVKEAIENEARLNENGKQRINLVVIGHVDAGKSTLMGHLLYLQGRVSKRLMHKYEKESKEQGKASFHFAWALDETEEERSRGVTIDVAVNYFESATKKVTLLDAPGHRDFIPNMISGTAQADAAVLVIPATRGEFEAGYMDDGQTKEHAVLARSLGVNQLIVAVNKLDTIGWDQNRYQEIQATLTPFLKSVGYKEKDISYVPVSGLTGENILERKEAGLTSWYHGPTLLDLIDVLQPPTRHLDRPLRLNITDVFKSMSLGATTVAGKIESGTILPKDRLLLLPLNEQVSVKGLEINGEAVSIARAGENVEIGLRDIQDPSVLTIGQWLCDPLHPIPLVSHFRAQIITMSYKIPLLSGSSLVYYSASTSEPVVLCKLLAITDRSTGAIIKTNPRVLPRNVSAEVEITCKKQLCLELFREYKELGRFTLRRGHETVAVGIITKLFRKIHK